MRFKDIPRFTRGPAYHNDVPLDFLKTWLNEMETDLHLNLNPDFQRGHVWSEEQQIAYVEYLLRGGQSGREIYFNMPGWNGDWVGDFVCVDGLQRLTACMRFINDEITVFGYKLSNFDDRLYMADVALSMNINNLKTEKEVLTWYIEMNTGGTVHTDEEIERVKRLLRSK